MERPEVQEVLRQEGLEGEEGQERLRRPVTVINGDHDLVGFTGRLHRRMLDPLENVEFVLLENAGHNAWIDRPEALRAELRRARSRGSAEEAAAAPGDARGRQ
jgi:pimeloyl-ACP methyl ester carboxylesterase